jgi:Xaa-Pro aminopeptidase
MTHQIQQFHVKGGPQYGRENLPKLRASLAQAGLDGFLIPHEDEYNNEYLPANAERLAWATGFTGSAGAAAVLGDVAAVFVDGRYTEQVKSQVDTAFFDYEGPGQDRHGGLDPQDAPKARPSAMIRACIRRTP